MKENNFLGKLGIILIIILGFIVFAKFNSFKKYFVQKQYYRIFEQVGIMQKCYHPYDIDRIFPQEEIDFAQADQAVANDGLDKLLDKSLKDKLTIPNITHHIYFTSSKSPLNLRPFYIEKMKANFNRLNAVDPNWQHFIWTNNVELFPQDLKNIKGVSFKSVEELKGHALHQYLVDTINEGDEVRARFMEASDILRLIALQKFGGIDQDMDYEIYNAKFLFELMKKFDFIGGKEFPRIIAYYGNAFIVAKPNHPVINEAIARLERYNLSPTNPYLPDYIKYPCSTYEKLYMNSPLLYTIAYLKKNNVEGNNDIILPSWMAFNANFALHKNGSCAYSKIDSEGFAKIEQEFPNLLADYTVNPKPDYFGIKDKMESSEKGLL
jgi:hypothetical protein